MAFLVSRRTPEWTDKPVIAKAEGQRQVSTLDADSLYKPMSTLYFGQPSTTERTGDTSAPDKPKTKTKTKGQPPQESLPATTDTGIEAVHPRPELYSVDARALKVFRTVFFNPAVTSSPGEVSWNDFVYAMTSTGMFAAKKLYGSIWQFSRMGGSDKSRTQFHEPHPRGKIPFVVARRHGRRLDRAFGWTGEKFMLKEKT